MADTIKRLKARVKYLESLLKCVKCDHLRHEHEGEDGPCQGGRPPDMKPGEGEYCWCGGFESERAGSPEGKAT